MVCRFKISGMTCAACSAGIQKNVNKLNGVRNADVSLMGQSMSVEFDEKEITIEKIISAVTSLGYGASLDDDAKQSEQKKRETFSGGSSFAEDAKRLKVRFLASLCFLIPLMYFTMGHMLGAPLPKIFDPSVYPTNFALIELILTAPIVFINFAFFRSGFKAAFKRVPNMDTLVSLGSAVAFLYSVVIMFILPQAEESNWHTLTMQNLFFESAAMVLTLVTLGKWLEARSKKKTGEEVDKLLKLAPDSVTVERGGELKNIPLREVVRGDIVVVRQGDSVPVDGTIVSGDSFVDKSAITGESLPVEVGTGDVVTSASINKGNVIKVRADKVGEDTVLSKIIYLVRTAGTSKAPIEKTVDKIAGVFVPIVLLIALLTFVVWMILYATGISAVTVAEILRMAISVLVISCPCALGLATPVAIMAATGRGASLGILYKDAEALQKAKNIRTVLLDKTATITEGKPTVTDIILFSSASREHVLSIAAGMELNSNHPLADCIVAQAKSEKIEIKDVFNFRYYSGMGAVAECEGVCLIGNQRLMTEYGVETESAQKIVASLSDSGKTVLYFAEAGQLVALIAISDVLKEGSRDAVLGIIGRGMVPVMLTGDSRQAATAIAHRVGIDQVYAEVLPEDKLNIVQENKKQGAVAMVGDGINDAPALKEADVGIAMGNGTDVAIDSADVVLVGGDLRSVNAAVDLSHATVRNIHENLFWAFIYNIICIPIAAGVLYPLGVVLDPMYGALAMSLSSVFVVTNALRLMRFKPKSMKKSASADKGEISMKKILKIEGMSCAHCSARVEQALNALDGVTASVELKKKRAIVVGDASDDVLVKVVEDAGYKVVGIEEK